MSKKKLGELLKEKNFIDDKKIKIAMAVQQVTGDLMGETLQNLGFVSSREIAQVLADQAEIEFLDLKEFNISENALRLIDRDIAERAGFIPLNVTEGNLRIGLTNPGNVVAIDTASKVSKMQIKPLIVDTHSYQEKIQEAYYFLENPITKKIEDALKDLRSSSSANSAVVSELTELLMQDGIRRNSTDIHFSPEKDTINIFYRIDGILQHGHSLPKTAQPGITSKVKVLAGMDIAEQRKPQDGHISFSFLNKEYDMRVSTIPTIHGENIVIRVLSDVSGILRISTLGFGADENFVLNYLFKKPNGIILITGPTGSGKTTTLYSALRELNILEKNVLTVEDPVEYRLTFIRQTQVNAKAGYDFNIAGRSFMRQDPDVILLGEIRDEETAGIAVRASVTGHLVLSTLHTNDAVSSIPRLLNLGLDKDLLATSLAAVVAQRLVRKICPYCKDEYETTEDEKAYLKFAGVKEKIALSYKGSGCETCGLTGYIGRNVVGEILVIDDEVKDLISKGSSLINITEHAKSRGMKLLRENAIAKVIEGVTTIEEVQRVVG